MSEPKFKIGDKVVVTNDIYMSKFIDKQYTIRGIKQNRANEFIYEMQNGLEFKESQLEKVEEEMKKEFTIKNLWNGDVVLHRNGRVSVYVCNIHFNSFVMKNGYDTIEHYELDLTNNINSDYDIMCVRRPKSPYECRYDVHSTNLGEIVYQRSEPEEMTLEEICKILGRKIKIVW